MLTYSGRGYGPAFAANYDAIMDRLRDGEDILVVSGPDDVCAPLLCEKEPHCHNESVIVRDRQAADAIAPLLSRPIITGEKISLTPEILMRLRAAFAAGRIRQACEGCEWHPLCTSIAAEGYVEAKLPLKDR